MYRNDNYTSQVPSLAGHVSAAHLAKESYGKYLSHADLTTYTDANAEQLAIRWLLRLNSLNPKTKFAFFIRFSNWRNKKAYAETEANFFKFTWALLTEGQKTTYSKFPWYPTTAPSQETKNRCG